MYEAHPYADIFPMMTAEEHDNLAKDIAANGMREPIVLYQGKILDGRNRYDAWRQVMAIGNEPPTVQYDGDDPLKYVISLNLHRRHLDASQRADVAAKLQTLKHGQRADRARDANLHVLTIDDSAAMLNVSARSICDAIKVQRDGIPALADAVTAGDVSVSAAAQVAKLTPEEQAQAVDGGKTAMVDAAKAVRERIKGMAEQSNNDITEAAQGWSESQRALHAPDAAKERGELRRLVKSIESLKSPEHYRRHAHELGMQFHISCSNVVEWLNRYLIIIDEEV